ncbi:hypothetical protein ACPPVQ_15490 [Diaminobutyricibacter sp. McL0618]|uniref:hypothetical protein n=1 Tax=Leifsonia sp. McL0618 TaxID=3415677 RepID=UPI003CE9C562
MWRQAYLAALAGAALVVVVLSGCAAGDAQEPSATGTSAADPTPTPRKGLAFDCASLASNDAVSALLGVDAGAIDAGVRAVSDIGRTFSQLEAAGGGSCLWGTPEAADVEKHGASVTIDVLPNSDGAWAKLAEWYPSTSTPGADYGSYPSRGGDCAQNYCHTNILVGNVWVAGEASSPTRPSISESEFHALMQHAVDVLAPIAGAATGVVPDAPHPACMADEYGAAAAASFGVPQASFRAPENMFRIEAAVGLVPGAEYCPYHPSHDGSGGVLVSLTVIPGGTAAFDHYRDLLATQGAEVTELTLESGGNTAHAIQRTIPGVEWATTSVDVMSGDDWLSVSAPMTTAGAASGSVAFTNWVLAHR